MTVIRILAWVALAALCGGPWAFGAAMPLHSMSLAAACLAPAALALAWAAASGSGLRLPRGAGPALVALAAAALVGLVPVPRWLHGVLVPGGAEILSRIGAGTDEWRPLSLQPVATLHAAALACAAAGVAWLGVNACSGRRTRIGFLCVLALLGAVLAAQGMWQHAHQSDPPKIYGTVEIYEQTTPFGPYVNRNHFGGVMALLFGCTAGLALSFASARRRVAATVAALAGAAQIAALAMTTSRGAFVAAAAAVAVLAATPLLAGVRIPAARLAKRAAVVLAAVAVMAVLVRLLGGEGGARLFNLYGRWVNRFGVQADALAGFADNPLVGTGAGTFGDVYPAWQRINDMRSFSNAHSDWAQFLMETGLVGAVAAVLCARALFGAVRAGASRGGPARWEAAGPAAGVAAVCAHGFFEVNLHIPANALLTALAASLACAPAAEVPDSGTSRADGPEDGAA